MPLPHAPQSSRSPRRCGRDKGEENEEEEERGREREEDFLVRRHGKGDRRGAGVWSRSEVSGNASSALRTSPPPKGLPGSDVLRRCHPRRRLHKCGLSTAAAGNDAGACEESPPTPPPPPPPPDGDAGAAQGPKEKDSILPDRDGEPAAATTAGNTPHGADGTRGGSDAGAIGASNSPGCEGDGADGDGGDTAEDEEDEERGRKSSSGGGACCVPLLAVPVPVTAPVPPPPMREDGDDDDDDGDGGDNGEVTTADGLAQLPFPVCAVPGAKTFQPRWRRPIATAQRQSTRPSSRWPRPTPIAAVALVVAVALAVARALLLLLLLLLLPPPSVPSTALMEQRRAAFAARASSWRSRTASSLANLSSAALLPMASRSSAAWRSAVAWRPASAPSEASDRVDARRSRSARVVAARASASSSRSWAWASRPSRTSPTMPTT
mmetsp:Transcript_118212/g.307003  ORF Transcript_118212/g.307003 Transcript_118212/m.307003 type:complete len:437 (+) Transcript_118212:917-2227(+)